MVVGTKCSSIGGLNFLKGSPTDVPSPGNVTVIELWAQWCGPCRQIFPHLSKIYKARQDKGLVVVGISVDDDAGLPAFVQGEGDRMAYTVAVDKSGDAGRLMKQAGVNGIPHAFVVDRSGTIVYSGHPAQPAFETEVDKALASASEPEKQALPLITASTEELLKSSVKELKTILEDRKISFGGVTEKSELVALIDKHCRNVTYYSA